MNDFQQEAKRQSMQWRSTCIIKTKVLGEPFMQKHIRQLCEQNVSVRTETL